MLYASSRDDYIIFFIKLIYEVYKVIFKIRRRFIFKIWYLREMAFVRFHALLEIVYTALILIVRYFEGIISRFHSKTA